MTGVQEKETNVSKAEQTAFSPVGAEGTQVMVFGVFDKRLLPPVDPILMP